jgi:hypothetical protein
MWGIPRGVDPAQPGEARRLVRRVYLHNPSKGRVGYVARGGFRASHPAPAFDRDPGRKPLERFRDVARPSGSLEYVEAASRLFEATFLVQTVPAWSSNKGKRLVKAPKLYLSDSGLLAHLLGWDAHPDPLARETGMLLENFVAMELRKHMGWSSIPTTLHHYRTFSGREVDFALEGPGGGWWVLR